MAPYSALPLKCMTVKKLTGSGMVAEGILVALRKIARTLLLAFGSWPQATAKAKTTAKATATAMARPLLLIHGQPGQVSADER